MEFTISNINTALSMCSGGGSMTANLRGESMQFFVNTVRFQKIENRKLSKLSLEFRDMDGNFLFVWGEDELLALPEFLLKQILENNWADFIKTSFIEEWFYLKGNKVWEENSQYQIEDLDLPSLR